jgi:DNA-binding Lrp family transcriptional regulator
LIAQTAEKNGLEREIERERILLGELPELSVQILELCRERGRIKIGEASKVTEISRSTIKDHAAALAENGHLVRHGAGNRAKSRQTLTRSCTVFRWSDSPTFRTLPPARNSQRILALCAISVVSVRRIEQRYARTVE